MKNTIWKFIATILVFTGLMLYTCKGSAQSGVFKYRADEIGYYKIWVERDSICIVEILLNSSPGNVNQWKEKITEQSKGHMYSEYFTSSGKWTMFFCQKDEQIDIYNICNVYQHPYIGDILHYHN